MEKIKYNGIIEKLVEEGTKNITKYAKVINDNEPVFDEIDYEVKEGEPVYFELDEQGRSNGAIAVISQNTIPLIINKNLQYPNPNGWDKSLEKKYLFQRCHIVAYSLSAKLADKKNIFIGTQDLNTSIMATIEKNVKKYVEQTGDKVLYKVTVKYKGIDKIPTGILIEAKAFNSDFKVGTFCYNVEKDVKFHYKDGEIFEDNRVNDNEILKSKPNSVKEDKNEILEKNKDYVINRKTNEFHLKSSSCKKLKNIPPKYINETTTKESNLLKINLVPCDVCLKK